MQKAVNIIRKVALQTDRVILFHSGGGKDSIALLHLMSPYFREIVPVYMYTVADLSHINKYINWSEKTYNVKFEQVPHYVLSGYIKYGVRGIKQDKKQKLITLADVDEMIRIKHGISWSFYGFKQNDSMNRRLMLRTYDEQAINENTKKVYPLSHYKNGDVLQYIKINKLLRPYNYSSNNLSSGTDIMNIEFLKYCKNKLPGDWQKIIKVFPECELQIYQHETKNRE